MAKHIELWALGRLVPNVRNPRAHSDAQVAQMAGSIAGFGLAARKLDLNTESIVAFCPPIKSHAN